MYMYNIQPEIVSFPSQLVLLPDYCLSSRTW